MLRVTQTLLYQRAKEMGAERKALIEKAILELRGYIEEGRFDDEVINIIMNNYRKIADVLFIAYSGLLQENGFDDKACECLKTVCDYYDKGDLKNSAYFVARTFMTYAISIEKLWEANPNKDDFRLIAKNINKAIARDKMNCEEPKLAWCKFLTKSGMVEAAKDNFEKLIKDHPDFMNGYYVYACFLTNRDKIELAIELCETALEKFPDAIKMLRLQAFNVKNHFDDNERAIELLEKALRLVPHSTDSNKQAIEANLYLALGIVKKDIGKFEEATKALQKAKDLDPQNAAIISAIAHSKQDKTETSNKDIWKLLAKVGKEFTVAKEKDPARFAKNHLSQSTHSTTAKLLVVERESSTEPKKKLETSIQPKKKREKPAPVKSYADLTAKLNYEKELAEIKKELVELDALVLECEEYATLNASLDFAESLAMGAQFTAAQKELMKARLQSLAKLKWHNSLITGTLKEFDPVKKRLVPATSFEAKAVAPTEKDITQPASQTVATATTATSQQITPTINVKPEKASTLDRPTEVKKIIDQLKTLKGVDSEQMLKYKIYSSLLERVNNLFRLEQLLFNMLIEKLFPNTEIMNQCIKKLGSLGYVELANEMFQAAIEKRVADETTYKLKESFEKPSIAPVANPAVAVGSSLELNPSAKEFNPFPLNVSAKPYVPQIDRHRLFISPLNLEATHATLQFRTDSSTRKEPH